MQPEFVRAEVERILKKYTCAHCGERTARVAPTLNSDQPIKCWKCSAEFEYTVAEFRDDTHKLGKAQIAGVLRTPAMKALDSQ